jgi:hypothetical protein
MLYLISHVSSPLAFRLFFKQDLLPTLLGLALIYDLPTSAFKVAVISSRHTGFSS